MPLRVCGCNRWHVFAIGNCIGQSFVDVNIACGIHPNIEIGKKSLNIPVSINILIKPETSDQPDRETCALQCHYL